VSIGRLSFHSDTTSTGSVQIVARLALGPSPRGDKNKAWFLDPRLGLGLALTNDYSF